MSGRIVFRPSTLTSMTDGACMIGSAPTGIAVGPSDDLQVAMDNAAAGSILLLDRAGVYTGNFVVPKALTITSAGPIPVGRCGPTHVGSLPIIRSSNNTPALQIAQNVDNVFVRGIQFDPATTGTEGIYIQVGLYDETDVGAQPANIHFDRIYINGGTSSKRGMALHSGPMSVTNSSIMNIKALKSVISETQAINIVNGPGPYTIRNCRLQASGENFMIGGDDPRIVNCVPELTFEDNYCDKPLEWMALSGAAEYAVKNIFELKNGRNCVIRRNIFDGNWLDAQTGWAIVFTPRNQYGNAAWATLENITFENNIVRNTSGGINILGDDNDPPNAYPSERTTGLYIRHNLLLVDRFTFGGDGRAMMIGQGPQTVEFEHNTCLTNGTSAVYFYQGASAITTVGGFAFNYNIMQHNSYGILSAEYSQGTPTVAGYCPDYEFLGNVFSGAGNVYPVGTLRPTVQDFATYVNVSTGALLPGSPYIGAGDGGSDLGVNFALLPS